MKKIIYLFLVCGIITNAQVKNLQETSTFYDFINSYKSQNSDTIPSKHIQRLSKIWGAKLAPNGDCKIAASAMQQYAQNYAQYNTNAYDPNWNKLGPTGTNSTSQIQNGQIHNIIFNPNYDGVNNKTIYATTSFGGVWRSKNDGMFWKNVNTDVGIPLSSVSDLAIHPTNPNILFAATGIADGGVVNFGYRSHSLNPVFSIGVYRSTDRGDTWQPINAGLENVLSTRMTIREIEINPENPDQLFIATDAGIFKTNNANDTTPTWTRVLQYRTDQVVDTEFKGLEFKPGTNNSSTVYASGQDIYKSTNGGDNWASMTGTGTGLDLENLPNEYDVYRINITVTPANENRVYAYIYGTESSSASRIYIYMFNGTNWDMLRSYTPPSGFETVTWNRLAIAVSPTDANAVFYGTTKLYGNANIESSNIYEDLSGYNSSGVGGFHVDIHSLEFPPNNGNKLFCGNDGGISVKTLPSSNIYNWESRNNGLAVATLWSFDDSDYNPRFLLAGFQDNFTKRLLNNTWSRLVGGDGYGAQINDFNDKNAFIISNKTLIRYDFSVGSNGLFRTECSPKPNEKGIFDYRVQNNDFRPWDSFVTNRSQLAIDFEIKNNPKTGAMYWTFSEINKRLKDVPCNGVTPCNENDNPDALWEKMSNIYLHEPVQWRRQLIRFEIAEANPDYRYIVQRSQYTPDGLFDPPLVPYLYKTINGSNDYTISNLPVESVGEYPLITDIVVDPANPERIFISYSSYNAVYKVWYSEDAGKTWLNADPNHTLPNLPVNAITYQNGTNDTLYVGTDAGVYVLEGINDANGWEKYGNFPNVNVQGLKINYCINKLRVATFGRGLWEGDLLEFNQELSEIVYNAGEHEIWEATEKRGIRNSVRIKANASLTIKGEISMPQNARIIIEPRGKLIIDGGKLIQSCGELWKGIVVLGNDNLPQTDIYQGVVEIINGALIENAEIGVLAANSSFENNDFRETGGIVRINNAVFRNNVTAVKIPAYTNANTSYIKNSLFETTSGAMGNIHIIPDCFVSLYDVGTIDITNNTFVNQHNISSFADLTLLKKQGKGIVSFNASINVKNNNFENLYKAIDSQGTNTRFCATRECLTTDIDNNNFINNWNAVYLNNNNAAKITSNDIQIFLTQIATQADGSSGLYILSSNGFQIEDNTMHALTTNGFTNGIYIQDCSAVNKIYKNYFNNLYTAIYANGKNTVTSPLINQTTEGLQIICNEFLNNVNDIYIAPDSYIAPLQGSDEISAGNTFNPICTNSIKEFNNQGLNQVNYISETPTEYQPNCNNNVNLFFTLGHNQCASTLTNANVNLNQLTSLNTSINQNKALLVAITDGGDTQALSTTVDQTQNNEALNLKNELLANSPYLSDTIMVKTTTIETILPPIMVKQVLAANPKAAKSSKVQNALDNRANQLPNYMRSEINLGKNVLSYKEELESSLSNAIHQRENMVNRLIAKYKRDTTATTQLKDLLIIESQQRLKRRYELVDYYLTKGEIQSAQNEFTNIPQNFNLTSAEQNKHNKIAQLVTIKTYVINNNKTWYQLSESQLTTINNLANDSNAEIKLQARAILSLINNTDYGMPIPPIETGGRHSQNTEVTNYNKFDVTPKEANNYFIIEYALDKNEKIKEATFEVYNNVGKKIITKNPKTKENQFLIECTNWKEGIYWCKKLNNNRVIKEIQFIIKKDKSPIGNNLIEKFNVYPNPTDNHFFIDFNLFNSKNTSIQITDAKGTLIKVHTIIKNNNKIRINTKTWQQGVYFVNLLSNAKLVKTVKVVIK